MSRASQTEPTGEAKRDQDPQGQRRRQAVQLAQPHDDRRHRPGPDHGRCCGPRSTRRRCRSSAAVPPTRPTSARTRACGRRRGAHRRRQGRQGRLDLARRTTRSRSSSRSRTRSSATRARSRSRSRPCSARSTSRSTRPARAAGPEHDHPADRARPRSFDVYPAFTELTQKIDAINTDQLAKALNTLSDDVQGTPRPRCSRC